MPVEKVLQVSGFGIRVYALLRNSQPISRNILKTKISKHENYQITLRND